MKKGMLVGLSVAVLWVAGARLLNAYRTESVSQYLHGQCEKVSDSTGKGSWYKCNQVQ